MKINYSENIVSKDYKCNNCGASGVKLWREYQTFSPRLLCAACAAKSQKKNIKDMNKEGMYPSDDLGLTDQIGWYIPAVPDEQGSGFWGYTSVPEDGVVWWKNMPNSIVAE
jgi:hypothetical protein